MNELPPNLQLPDQAQQTFQMVRVTNRNAFAILDRWDGVPYVFSPNKSISIPMDAAAHFFAWPGEPDYVRFYVAKRHGWNTQDDIARADKDGKSYDETGENRMRWEVWVSKIDVAAVHFDLVQRDPDAPIPADAGGEDAEMMDGGDDLPMPIAAGADISGTRVGVRTRSPGRKPPRRIDP